MARLARKLRLTDYFTLAFGTMVGVGWLVVMDDWLGRGGPLGGILGFPIGGGAPLPARSLAGRTRSVPLVAARAGPHPPQGFPPPPPPSPRGVFRVAGFFFLCRRTS